MRGSVHLIEKGRIHTCVNIFFYDQFCLKFTKLIFVFLNSYSNFTLISAQILGTFFIDFASSLRDQYFFIFYKKKQECPLIKTLTAECGIAPGDAVFQHREAVLTHSHPFRT